MERFVITTNQKLDDRYVWTRNDFKSAIRLAISIHEQKPEAIICILDIGSGILENWRHGAMHFFDYDALKVELHGVKERV